MKKTRVAFIKYAGMTIGGSELWLQKIAANLPKDRFEVDFFYCDDVPYKKGAHAVLATSMDRVQYLKDHGVRPVQFKVGSKSIHTLTHKWIDTDFWEKFDSSRYDLVQTVKAGPKEYPFYKIPLPVVEIVALANRPDTSKNIVWSFHSSEWQRKKWIEKGGLPERSSVLPSPTEIPQTTENYRRELNIPEGAVVAGFHQRADNNIFSSIPLQAFATIQKKYLTDSANWHFVIKNGGSKYREQASSLGIKNIHFLAETSDSTSVSKFLNTLDFFAHGRKDGETFGAVFVEAMIHGKACLSHYSPDGANAQIETMGPAGLFAYSIDEYKKYLHQLFSDKKLRVELSSKAVEFVRGHHSIEACIKEITRRYEIIMENPTYRYPRNPSILKALNYKSKEITSRYAKGFMVQSRHTMKKITPRKALAYVRNKYYGQTTRKKVLRETPSKVVNADEYLQGLSDTGNPNKKYIIRFKGGYAVACRQADLTAIAETCILGDYQYKHVNRIKPGDVVFDIGAHIGSFSIYAANLGATVYAFEPHPTNYSHLLENIKLNGFENKIHPFNMAISGKQGAMYLRTDGNNSGGFSIADASDSQSPDTIEIKADSISNILKQFSIPKIDLIKIDTEGSEYSILRDTEPSTFQKISCIVGEYHLSLDHPEQKFSLVKKLLSKSFTKIGRYDPYYFYAKK